jgi:alkanesulfonate monooxygenase SsuD/methylene tetrahydromethanopterin reductase-like flavin-dependent oxidoreductase (luciferase family)
MADVRFGLFLCQVNRSWRQVLDEFRMAEELGFNHAWLCDHLLNTEGPPDDPIHEAWTLLAALAASTSRIRLGVLVSSNTFRHPAVMLKQAVTVDHISNGRLILGIGAGWYGDEHQRYGIPLPPPGPRVDRFAEAVQVLDLLMGGQRATFKGDYYELDDAPLQPRPVQQPRIPLLISAHRPRMLAIAARYADQWDTFAVTAGTATEGVEDDMAARIRGLDEACAKIGRDPATIRRSTWATSAVLASEQAYLDFYGHHRDLGFTDFITVLPEPADRPVLEAVARTIIPRLRAEAASAG